ncbi:MAG: hypothetical protein LBJ02_06150 [Bifidobacteriaceae bacterium]|nr:hypothetical protein [Bifidobacteriaceae bacterium]
MSASNAADSGPAADPAMADNGDGWLLGNLLRPPGEDDPSWWASPAPTGTAGTASPPLQSAPGPGTPALPPRFFGIDRFSTEDLLKDLRRSSQEVDTMADSMPRIPSSSDPGTVEAAGQVLFLSESTANLLELIDAVAASLDTFQEEASAHEDQLSSQFTSLFWVSAE